MKIKIEDLRQKVQGYLRLKGMNEHDREVMADLVVEQEMIGNQFDPVGGLAGKHARLEVGERNLKEEVVVERAAVKLLKGNGRLAPLITADHLDEAVEGAKKEGIYALGIYDCSYNDFFDVFCRRVAAKDCVAIIMENGGPQGTVPFGGRKDVLGTNPIAYGIPTRKFPIVFDAATAAHAYSRIKQAKEKGEKLPDNAYVDKEGNITTDPNTAWAVLPFGGFKGYAINLLLEVLSGVLVRGMCGLDVPLDSPDRYLGTLIVIIDPAVFGKIGDFKDATTKLVKDILAVPPVDPASPVKVPGIRGSERRERFEKEGWIEIEDREWEKFATALEKIKEVGK